MFTIFSKKPLFNKTLGEYCMKSTMNSVQNMIERRKLSTITWDENKERFKYSNLLVLSKEQNLNPNSNNNPYITIAIAILPILYFFLSTRKN
jgi:hypothetical protein